MTHDGQCADNLPHRRPQTFQLRTLAGVAEEAVKHLLYLSKVALNFLGNLTDQQFLLRLPRHLVKQRNLGSRLRCLPGHATADAFNDHINLVNEIGADVLQIL